MDLAVLAVILLSVAANRGASAFEYIDCYDDYYQNRVMDGAYHNLKDNNSPAQCENACRAFKYFGLEHGNECYCGNYLPIKTLPRGSCMDPCPGQPVGVYCGGRWALSVYLATPQIVQKSHVGCYEDTKDRVYKYGPYTSSVNSPAFCRDICVGWIYFGLEHGDECFCGDRLPPKRIDHKACNTKCPADRQAQCGGRWAMDVYITESQEYNLHVGCYQDSKNRVFPKGPIKDSRNSPEFCLNMCLGYYYYGMEHGNECFCGDKLPPERISNNNCNTKCPGNNQADCGGSWAIDVYRTEANGCALGDGSSSKALAEHKGCYQDSTKRVFTEGFHTIEENSPLTCLNKCEASKFFGLENKTQCFCGGSLPASRIPLSHCSEDCLGTPGTTCGGNFTMNVYSTTPQIPASQYLGCFQDSPQTLTAGFHTIPDNSPQACQKQCEKSKYFALGNTTECYCGDVLPDSRVHLYRCSEDCPGQHGTTCGGNSTLDVYSTTPLTLAFKYLGCYGDNPHTFTEGFYTIRKNSPLTCEKHCISSKYFALTNKTHCFCADNMPLKRLSGDHCTDRCPGDSRQSCGGYSAITLYSKIPVESLIYRGAEVTIEKYPYQLFLQVRTWKCGGSIISDFWALTAAHCVVDDYGGPNVPANLITVRSGSRLKYKGGELHDVQRVFPHTSFNWRTLEYDIACLKVVKKFAFSTTTRAVPLVSLQSAYLPGTLANISGWGKTEFGGECVGLRAIELPLISIEDCQKYEGVDKPLPSFIVCTYKPASGPSTGDSGGPLVSYGKQIGVDSSADPTHNTNRPLADVYTKVLDFKNWICTTTGSVC